ncbi:MAG: hypothetical protein R3F15_07455 [Lysobacterales bacterium]
MRALIRALPWLCLCAGAGAQTPLPDSCHREQLTQPRVEAEAAETWAWRVGKLRAQARAEPNNEALQLAQLDAAQRLLALAAVAEAEGDADRAQQLRQLTQDGLGGQNLALLLDQRAASGDPLAIAAQVESLLFGVLHERATEQACAILVSLPETGLGWTSRYRLAQCLRDGDPAQSLQRMRESAHEGHPAAAEAIALLCQYGREQDADCLLRWGCAAVAGGRARLAPDVAEALLARDDALGARARDVLRIAASQGDPASMHLLGQWLHDGTGGPVDSESGRQWWERAADQGYAPARLSLRERD